MEDYFLVICIKITDFYGIAEKNLNIQDIHIPVSRLCGKNNLYWCFDKKMEERNSVMDGENRRNQIIKLLENSKNPLSGNELAKKMNVSRQVIVQDIALLRAVNKNILSTNKGYILFGGQGEKTGVQRIVRVKHENCQILEELYAIVDSGGKVRDVVVEHDIYGQITVDLIINSRKDADDFVEKIKKNQTKPLNELTDGDHYHTIEADSEEILDEIERKLEKKGFKRN